MRALISTYDKTGLLELASWLVQEGVALMATGGTAAALDAAGLPVQDTQTVTGFGEILGGRVKTLHPGIFGGILADGSPEHARELEEAGIAPIDIVVANLYPFRQAWLTGQRGVGPGVHERRATFGFEPQHHLLLPDSFGGLHSG